MLEASLGTTQHHNNLTIFPILAEKPREVSYGLMAEALALGILTIREKNGGEVPLLLAPNSITEIPVSCMEQGRWHHETDHFSPAPQHAPSVGSGDYRILRGKVLGGELAYDEQLVHVSAFPAIQHDRGLDEGPEDGPGGPRRPRARPIARPSRRRRGF